MICANTHTHTYVIYYPVICTMSYFSSAECSPFPESLQNSLIQSGRRKQERDEGCLGSPHSHSQHAFENTRVLLKLRNLPPPSHGYFHAYAYMSAYEIKITVSSAPCVLKPLFT